MRKTHNCNALTAADAGKQVSLVGWIDSVRDHGGIAFVDLRDREGITQLVFDPQNGDFSNALRQFKQESVIAVTGAVKPRAAELVNARINTGTIEVFVSDVEVLNVCDTLPFPMEDERADKVNEDLRLSYRYLDLRRPKNLGRLRMRHKAGHAIRNYLDEQGFIEVETPTLFKSTPEGAREFLVPSRLNPGEFYALTQSPQQYKQMLMVAGVERYYQMARCYRDEDLRADRQPEFTQVDLEMSFIDREDMYALIEGMLKRTWKEVLNIDIQIPFLRMPYYEAMNRFGVDKPDMRFEMELQDFTEAFKNSAFKVFASVAQSKGGSVKAINAKSLADATQGEMKALEEAARALGAKGLAYIKVEGNEWKSPIAKFLSDEERTELIKRLKIEDGDLILFSASEWEKTCGILGRLRLECAQLLVKRGRLEIPSDLYKFLWVIEFPLMLKDEESGRYVSAHHPFTAPVVEDVSLLDSEPEKVRGQHYDIVLNGVELGGGSIRIHQPAVQKKVFEDVLKIPADIVESRFGYMLKAFSFGAPPHGGIALGFDRLCTILAKATSIRDVIAFPKTQRGQDLMAKSPGAVTARQLSDVFIARALPEDK